MPPTTHRLPFLGDDVFLLYQHYCVTHDGHGQGQRRLSCPAHSTNLFTRLTSNTASPSSHTPQGIIYRDVKVSLWVAGCENQTMAAFLRTPQGRGQDHNANKSQVQSSTGAACSSQIVMWALQDSCCDSAAAQSGHLDAEGPTRYSADQPRHSRPAETQWLRTSLPQHPQPHHQHTVSACFKASCCTCRCTKMAAGMTVARLPCARESQAARLHAPLSSNKPVTDGDQRMEPLHASFTTCNYNS